MCYGLGSKVSKNWYPHLVFDMKQQKTPNLPIDWHQVAHLFMSSDGSGIKNTRPPARSDHFWGYPNPPETRKVNVFNYPPARYSEVNTRKPAGIFRVLKWALFITKRCQNHSKNLWFFERFSTGFFTGISTGLSTKISARFDNYIAKV